MAKKQDIGFFTYVFTELTVSIIRWYEEQQRKKHELDNDIISIKEVKK